jgi:hypothetical protein
MDHAATLSVPKAAPANSFVLHAPLELMARTQLLRYAPPNALDAAMDRIEWLGKEYAAAGESVAPPEFIAGPPDAAALVAAVMDGNQSLVDAMAAAWLPQWSAAEVVDAVGEALAPSLAAAGHAPIGLALLRRDVSLPTTLLRGPLRSLAAQPTWRIGWHDSVAAAGDPGGLHDALRAAPQLGRPGSDFIYPLMSQAVDSGEASRLLAPLLADSFDVPQALRTLTRVAAWSMLHDDPAQAPYGWTHALTMPQAVMSLAGAGVRPRTALAVAATFALGFRLAHGQVQLPPTIEPVATAATIHDVAGAACSHDDAHLVKYTLACIHAAEDDPECASLYLAAAAHLVHWWRVEDAATDR